MPDDQKPKSEDEPIEEPESGPPEGEDGENEENEEVFEVLSEINRLGRQLGTAVSRAWESDERKRVEDELTDGLQRAGKEIHRLGEDLAGTPAMESAKKGAGSAARELRTGVLGGLRFLNRELGKALDKAEPPDSGGGEDEPEDESGDR